MTAGLLLIGLIFLLAGAELLVRGASRVALALRIPPLIVGLTIVAFGTSSPELAVSANAALSGTPEIATGNVVGSNIFNVLLILGLSALLAPLRVSSQLVRIDVPVMIGASLALLGVAWNGRIGPLEGAVLLAGMMGYLAYLFRIGERSEADPVAATPTRSRARALALDGLLVVAGLGLLVLGSGWLVESARTIAVRIGVSELLIGLTVVAAGTSLPELATSVMATVRGERDIAVGNVVGSNIFNILAILAISALLAPAGLPVTPAAITFDIPIATAVAVACLPVFFSGGVIARWEGGVFVAYYLAYVVYLALDATGHGARPAFRDAMLYFVIPLTAVTLAVVALRSRRLPG